MGEETSPSCGMIAAEERQSLLTGLLEAVKQCQIRFGGRKELATEEDSRVACLCYHFEAVLQHGFRNRPTNRSGNTLRQVTEIVSNSLHRASDAPVFWHYAREHLTRHEYERYLLLSAISTDMGRGRAWLRSALNEHSLERYLHMLMGDSKLLSSFYHSWSFLCDQERSSMLPVMAAGLGSILFAISINNPRLNEGSLATSGSLQSLSNHMPVDPPSLPPNPQPISEKKKRRKVLAHIVSFDENDSVSLTSASSQTLTSPVCSSAPPTCLSSPTALSAAENTAPWDKDSSLTKKEKKKPNPLVICSSDTVDLNDAQTLTPLNGYNIGKLIPLPIGGEEPQSEEDSISVPSYSEELDSAASALAAVHRALQTNSNAALQSSCTNTSEQSRTQSASHNEKLVSSSLSTSELRQALLSALGQKEDLSQQVKMLHSLLQQEGENANSVRQELRKEQQMEAERADRAEARLQALSRENELLKHQLKKYVGAVQMLRRDGSQAHETLASLVKSGENDTSQYVDYHLEATEYERKLIQVAEMHGELMEFNEWLHRQIQSKDAAIRRLREELVDLRGPLPDDCHTSDEEGDTVSVTSDYDNSSLAAASRVLINLWIPSAFLTGSGSDTHHVYQVYIRIRDDEWNIYRRYAHFYSLHKELRKRDPVINTFDFPPKKALGNKDAKFVEERRKKLQHYTRCVINHFVQSNADLAANPSRELLVHCVPFFGDSWDSADKRSKKKITNRSPFSRIGSPSAPASSPQYTGL